MSEKNRFAPSRLPGRRRRATLAAAQLTLSQAAQAQTAITKAAASPASRRAATPASPRSSRSRPACSTLATPKPARPTARRCCCCTAGPTTSTASSMSPRCWRSRGYRVIVPYLRGYGTTTLPLAGHHAQRPAVGARRRHHRADGRAQDPAGRCVARLRLGRAPPTSWPRCGRSALPGAGRRSAAT